MIAQRGKADTIEKNSFCDRLKGGKDKTRRDKQEKSVSGG